MQKYVKSALILSIALALGFSLAFSGQNITRGICAILGDVQCKKALEMARKTELLIYVQLQHDKDVEAARRAAETAGLLGNRIFVEQGDYSRVHLADNLADILYATGEAEGLDEAEALRILRPGGEAHLPGKKRIKPIPDGVDDWSHPYHGPDNNPLSEDRAIRAPYRTQFMADPRYAPLPQVAVASAGRVFKAFGHVAFKEREEPWLNTLVAFNGYNGTILWKRDLVPGIMVHRNTLIATPETVYLGDDTSCKVIDAATGRLKKEIKPSPEVSGGTFWKWMALENGTLYALIGEQEHRDPVERHKRDAHGWPWEDISVGFNMPENPWGFGRTLLAIDLETDEILWSHQETEPADSRALCMKGGRLFLFRHGAYLVCLDTGTGKELWRKTAPSRGTDHEAPPSSSLSVRIESLDKETGKVVLNGMDTRRPEAPFTWEWGDGIESSGFFPQEHTYPDPSKNYTLKVTAHYNDGGRTTREVRIHFQGPTTYSKENAPELFEALGTYINRQGWNTNWRTTCYLKCSDKALYFSGPQVGKLLAVSAEDGTVLWEDPYDNFQLVLREDGLYGISGPWDVKKSKIFDPLTGRILAEMEIGRRACSRPSGTMDAIFFRARGGSVRLDLATRDPQWISPMRAQCHDGVTITNGLLYWWPSVCDCNLSIYGVTSLGPAGGFDFYRKAAGTERLEEKRGSKDSVLPLPESPADWPTFRGNNACTATSKASVPERGALLWTYTPKNPNVPTAPTVAGGLVFVSGSDGIVRALDAATGEKAWSAFTGGQTPIPPTIHDGRALVGSGDGHAYAFEAKTGRLLWRFRAAPEARVIPVYGKLHSTWPVASGVLVEGGIAYFAAGIVNYDGTYVYALDARTGKLVWQNVTSGHLDRQARTGASVHGHLLLHKDKLYMAGGCAVSPAVYAKNTGKCLNSPEQLEACEARCSRGWELYLVGEKVVACGRPFYAHPEYRVFDDDVYNKLLVASTGDRDITLVDNHKLSCYPRINKEQLTRCVADRDGQSWFSYNWGNFEIPGVEPYWSKNCKGTVAIAVCKNAVVIARETEIIALSLEAGEILWVQRLPAPPVSWGLAVDRDGNTIVTLKDGRVLCIGVS